MAEARYYAENEDNRTKQPQITVSLASTFPHSKNRWGVATKRIHILCNGDPPRFESDKNISPSRSQFLPPHPPTDGSGSGKRYRISLVTRWEREQSTLCWRNTKLADRAAASTDKGISISEFESVSGEREQSGGCVSSWWRNGTGRNITGVICVCLQGL